MRRQQQQAAGPAAKQPGAPAYQPAASGVSFRNPRTCPAAGGPPAGASGLAAPEIPQSCGTWMTWARQAAAAAQQRQVQRHSALLRQQVPQTSGAHLTRAASGMNTLQPSRVPLRRRARGPARRQSGEAAEGGSEEGALGLGTGVAIYLYRTCVSACGCCPGAQRAMKSRAGPCGACFERAPATCWPLPLPPVPAQQVLSHFVSADVARCLGAAWQQYRKDQRRVEAAGKGRGGKHGAKSGSKKAAPPQPPPLMRSVEQTSRLQGVGAAWLGQRAVVLRGWVSGQWLPPATDGDPAVCPSGHTSTPLRSLTPLFLPHCTCLLPPPPPCRPLQAAPNQQPGRWPPAPGPSRKAWACSRVPSCPWPPC